MTNVGRSGEVRADDRRVVAVAHPQRDAPADLVVAIESAAYRLVSVAVRRNLIDELTVHAPAVVVVDASMAAFDTVRLCRDIRASVGSRILVLAACELATDERWTAEVIESGADGIVPRSISVPLLRTHVLALMRLAPERDRTTEVVVGDVVIDVHGHSVYIDGSLVPFPKVQFELLLAFARRPNKAVSFGQLLAEVWRIGPPSIHPRRVRVAVSHLRELLGEGARRPHLDTVSRVGYRLVLPPC